MGKSHIITDMDSILNIVNDENIDLFMQDFEAWLRACIRIKKVAPSTKVTNLILDGI